MNHVSRRSFIGTGLALFTAGAVPLAAPRSTRTFLSRDFSDAIGICTHPNWRERLWGNTDWESAFLETGVRNTRGKIGNGRLGLAALSDLQKLFKEGVKICATVADSKLDRQATLANVEFLADQVGSRNLSGIESANEYNKPGSRPPHWAAELRQFQQWLHQTVRANPKLAGVPLVAPSIWGRLTEDYAALGNLEPYVDRGNLHYYTGGRRPTRAGRPRRGNEGGGLDDYGLQDAVQDARTLAPGAPLWITEYGFPVAGPGLPLARGFITEEAAAKYLLRGLFDAFRAGAEKIFIYTLMDDAHRSPPRYHGLMDARLRRRPAFNAVKNLMTLFHGGSDPSPGKLEFAFDTSSSVKHQLFSKDSRTFLLAAHQDVDSYDRLMKSDTKVASVPATLILARPAARIAHFTPTFSVDAQTSVRNSGRLEFPVGDHVSIVEINL